MRLDEAGIDIIRCGSEQVDEPGRVLTAGPMSVEFDGGQLRYLRVNGVEVLRAVGFLVRDENWGTYVPEISDLSIEQRDAGFSVSFHAVCKSDTQQIAFDAQIDGDASGLRFVGTAIPATDFLTARTGFVVLHPLKGVAGCPVRVEHVDGKVVNDKFPPLVDPVQPFLNIRSLTHEVRPGLSATVLMEGDTFEMEDHRNWTDASFKTYVRPLALPWPYTLPAGEPVQQSITVTLSGEARAGEAGQGDDTVSISLGHDAGPLPALGLGVPAEEIAPSLAQKDLVGKLTPKTLIGHFDPRENHGSEQLAGYRALAELTGADLVLEAVVQSIDRFDDELAELAGLVSESGLSLAGLAVVPVGDLKSVLPGGERPPAPELEALYESARRHFPGVPLGGGMFSFFTELNRKRVPTDNLDFVVNTTCPIVHAADDRSVMETLEALPYQVATAREFLGDCPHRIGPSGIGCRDNPHGATWTPNPSNHRVCLTRHDPRQRGLFGAAWTLGYIATLAHTGVEAIAMGAPTGPLGVVYRKADHAQPGFDGQGSPAVFPAFHVLRSLFGQQGATLVSATSAQPEAVLPFALRGTDGVTRLWVANLTADEQRVELDGGAADSLTGRVLDKDSFVRACTDPMGFESSEKKFPTTFSLAGYAVAMLRL